MPDVPTRTGTARLHRHTNQITDNALERETNPLTSEYDGSPAQDLTDLIHAGDPDLEVFVGKAGDHVETGPFVKLDSLTSNPFAGSMSVECWALFQPRMQVAYYAADMSGATAGRDRVAGWVASSGRWMLDGDSTPDVFPDTTVHPWLWVALFVTRQVSTSTITTEELQAPRFQEDGFTARLEEDLTPRVEEG